MKKTIYFLYVLGFVTLTGCKECKPFSRPPQRQVVLPPEVVPDSVAPSPPKKEKVVKKQPPPSFPASPPSITEEMIQRWKDSLASENQEELKRLVAKEMADIKASIKDLEDSVSVLKNPPTQRRLVPVLNKKPKKTTSPKPTKKRPQLTKIQDPIFPD